MKSIVHSGHLLIVILIAWSAPGSAEQPKTNLDAFTSRPAIDAVKEYRKRLEFLEERVAEERQKAKDALVETLKETVNQVVTDGDFDEVKRLSAFVANPKISKPAAEDSNAKQPAEEKTAASEASGRVSHWPKTRLSRRQIAGREADYFWQITPWQFEPGGLIRSVRTGKVYDQDHHWEIDRQGRLVVKNKNDAVTAVFTAIKTDEGIRLIGGQPDTGEAKMIVIK